MSSARTILAVTLAAGLLAAFGTATQAAVITWGAPTDSSSYNDVISAGALIQAVNEGSDVLTVDPGGLHVPFSTANDLPNNLFGGSGPGVNTGDANLNRILNTASWSVPDPTSLTVSGLNVGSDYQIQLFYTDTRACCNTRTQTYTAGNTSAPASASGSGNGQFVVGTFTADAPNQSVSLSNSGDPTLNAYVLRRTSGVAAPASGVLGNTLSNRAFNSDNDARVFWSNAYGAPVAGSVDSVEIYFQGNTQTFELFQLRPTGAANQFDVIARSGVITPSGAPNSASSLPLPNGAFQLQKGDMLFHYGRGIPYTDNLARPDAHNSQNIYYPSSSPPTVGSTLGLRTVDFPIHDLKRDYAWSVESGGFVETVGNGAGDRYGSNAYGPDTAGSILVVMDNDPFTQPGRLNTWQFFNDTPNTGGRNITPALLRQTANGLQVVGIGATRVGTENGFQQHDFFLVDGSDLVEPGDLFGFYYGDANRGNLGSVEFIQIGAMNIRLFTENLGDGLQLADVFNSPNWQLPRYYSANASTVASDIPEPATLVLTALGLLVLGPVARRRR